VAATDLERLVVQLSADISKYNNSLNKARGQTDKQARAIESRFAKMNKGIAADLSGLAGKAAAAFAAIAGARELKELSDAATRIDNSLKVAGLSGEELEKVYQSLNKSAVANGAPLETLADLYSKASQAQNELGVTSAELLSFTNNVALALRVSGKSAQEASGALLQLGQALGSGKVQAEEFNSVLEGAPTIVQAVAAGLKEAGGSVSALKGLIVDGKVSSEAFFRAFEAGAPILEQKVANSVFTIDQSLGNLKTALIDSVREFNNATGAGELFADGINTAAKAVNDFDITNLVTKVRQAKNELDDYLNSLGNAEVFKNLNKSLGVTDAEGNIINVEVDEAKQKTAGLERDVELLQERIKLNTEMGFDNTEALARLGEVQAALASIRASAANLPATVDAIQVVPGSGLEQLTGGTNGQMGGPSTRGGARRKATAVTPVSLSDFKAPAGKSGSGKKKQSEYQREVEQIKERTAATLAETAAQAQVNPLIDDYGYAIERAAAEHELLAAAQASGLAITPALRASIAQLAEGYAQAGAAAERLQDSQDKARQASEEFKSTAKDVTSGFISDLRNGVSAADALSNALGKVVDKLIDVGLNAAFGIGGGGGGGLIGGIGKIFGFAKGGIAAHGKPMKTFARGGVSNSAAIFGEAGPEAAVPLPDGRSIPVKFQQPSVPRRQSSSGSSITYAPTIDARGADGEAVARLERVIAKDKAEFQSRVVSTVREAQKRRQV
jgi:tape measure domain-containing protein